MFGFGIDPDSMRLKNNLAMRASWIKSENAVKGGHKVAANQGWSVFSIRELSRRKSSGSLG